MLHTGYSRKSMHSTISLQKAVFAVYLEPFYSRFVSISMTYLFPHFPLNTSPVPSPHLQQDSLGLVNLCVCVCVKNTKHAREVFACPSDNCQYVTHDQTNLKLHIQVPWLIEYKVDR